MIGVQCQLICREHIRVCNGTFQFCFVIDGLIVKLTKKSDFSLLSTFAMSYAKYHKWVGRSKVICEVNLNMVYDNPMQKQEIFYLGPA